MSRAALFETLEQRLKSPRPGLASQLKMVPHPRPGHMIYKEIEGTCLKAGVLLLLYPRDDVLHLVLIQRTCKVLHHRDQIGFPGGQMEPMENFEQAALREAWEELGIPQDRIKIIGALTPLYIPPSNFCVYPVVGVAERPLAFSPHPDEVHEVIEVPLRHLMSPEQVRKETRMIHGDRVEVPFYAFGRHKIWGATAMVLAEFLEILGSSGGLSGYF